MFVLSSKIMHQHGRRPNTIFFIQTPNENTHPSRATGVNQTFRYTKVRFQFYFTGNPTFLLLTTTSSETRIVKRLMDRFYLQTFQRNIISQVYNILAPKYSHRHLTSKTNTNAISVLVFIAIYYVKRKLSALNRTWEMLFYFNYGQIGM